MLAKSNKTALLPKSSQMFKSHLSPDQVRRAVVKLQAFARMINCRRKYYDKFVSAVLIQSSFRKRAAITFRKKYLHSLVTVQRSISR